MCDCYHRPKTYNQMIAPSYGSRSNSGKMCYYVKHPHSRENDRWHLRSSHPTFALYSILGSYAGRNRIHKKY